MIITARCCTILLALLLSAFSSVQTTELTYVRPSPPTEKAIGAAIAKEAKLVTPLEISALRPNDHGTGSFFVCIREVNSPPDKPRRYYSTFLDQRLQGFATIRHHGSMRVADVQSCTCRCAGAASSYTGCHTCQAQAPPELDAMTIGLVAFSRTSRLAPHPYRLVLAGNRRNHGGCPPSPAAAPTTRTW